LTNNDISACEKDPGILAMVPFRQAKTVIVRTAGDDLAVIVEMVDPPKKGSRKSRVIIANITSGNRKDAFKVKGAITRMLADMKYNSYPSQRTHG
jgi:hypothetical protein